MKTTTISAMLVLALVWLVGFAEAAPMGTVFTYQGRLIDSNSPADGEYDFQFQLYDDANIIDGNQMGSTIELDDLDVIDGYFTVELDYGSGVFNGDARWLEIDVRPGNSIDVNDFMTLSPRQKVTPTPYALHTRGIFIDDGGRIGVGTTKPWYLLDVFKEVTDNWLAGFHNTGTGSTDGGVIVRAFGGDPLLVQSATANVLNVKQNGNVGIGTNVPDKKLTVAEGGFAVYPGPGGLSEPAIITDDFDIKLGDIGGIQNEVSLEIRDSDKKFVFHTGDVGIGIANPTRSLDIYRYDGPANVGIVAADSSSKAQIIFGDGGGNKWTISSDNTDDDKLHLRSGHASGTPRITFQQDGNVGIGTTNPGEKLEVEGNIDVSSNRVKHYHGFPRPDYDSGWQQMTKGLGISIQHDLGGDPNNYVVDMQFKAEVAGVNQILYGGEETIDGRGAYWRGLTDTEIFVYRETFNLTAEYIRIRIWVYD